MNLCIWNQIVNIFNLLPSYLNKSSISVFADVIKFFFISYLISGWCKGPNHLKSNLLALWMKTLTLNTFCNLIFLSWFLLFVALLFSIITLALAKYNSCRRFHKRKTSSLLIAVVVASVLLGNVYSSWQCISVQVNFPFVTFYFVLIFL